MRQDPLGGLRAPRGRQLQGLRLLGPLVALLVLLAALACGDPPVNSTSGPEPTNAPVAVATPEPTRSREPTPASEPTPTPTATPEPKMSLDPGMYQVGSDIQPGIYAGLAGTDIVGSCYWARLSGASGDFSELLANENAIGQFYVEVQDTDKYFKVDCEITPLKDWPTQDEPLSKIGLVPVQSEYDG